MQKCTKAYIKNAPKFFIRTFGCQMNDADSELMAGKLVEAGYIFTRDIDSADIILVNTCCVRQHAEERVYGYISSLYQRKKNNPQFIMGVCGCLVQKEKERIFQRLPYVDLIVGTHQFLRIAELVNKVLRERRPVIEVGEPEAIDLPWQLGDVHPLRNNTVRTYVTIMRGCNNFCSYCVVPYVRGRQQSRSPQEILQEVKDIAQKGYKEVTLLGQNVTAYGKDLSSNIDFPWLLEQINALSGIERIRYITSHPRDVDEKLIFSVRDLPRVCEHFHLPVQSGSNRILKLMNRGYDINHFQKIVSLIRNEIPEATITTDFIVGFPGETEDDFQATLNLVQEISFDEAFMFQYSLREDTRAAVLPDQVSEEEKKRRLQELINLQQKYSYQSNSRLIGKSVEVLVESVSRKHLGKLLGRTRTNKVVLFPGEENLVGNLLMVKVTGATAWTLEGVRENKDESARTNLAASSIHTPNYCSTRK